MTGNHNLSSLIWGFADILYNNIEESNYHKVILPLTLLRRFDCVLSEPGKGGRTAKENTKHLKERFGHLLNGSPADRASFDGMAVSITGVSFYNLSALDFEALAASSPSSMLANFRAYIDGFSDNVKDILENFSFTGNTPYLEMLHKKGILSGITQRFAGLDLSPTALPNEDMGELYEELVRKWADTIKADAGEFFTPRDIVHLLVDLVFAPDDERLSGDGVIRTAYDPTIGTGGLLTVAEAHARKTNPGLRLNLYGQELKDISYAVCKADLLIKHSSLDDQVESRVEHGNTLRDDKFKGRQFDYIMANPPYGAPWGGKNMSELEQAIRAQAHRFPGGFPQTGDSALLFVQHMVSKMKPASEGGARAGIVLAGSPLFNGDAASGESEIRRYLIENDLVEAIVALPTELFFDTGIGTFIWILSNRKSAERKGKIQLIDARELASKVRKAAGMKRYEITDDLRAEILAHYTGFAKDTSFSKVFDGAFFGYRKVKVKIGEETDYERMSLAEDLAEYMTREVLPFEPAATVDVKYTDGRTGEVGRIGYEINFNRYFYVAKELEASADILKRIQGLEAEFVALMKGVL
jgi:type I restriction enzyme M protein